MGEGRAQAPTLVCERQNSSGAGADCVSAEATGKMELPLIEMGKLGGWGALK